MKYILHILFLLFFVSSFGQDKTYSFLYNYQQKGKLSDETKRKNRADLNKMAEDALNQSFGIEVLADKNISLIKVLPKVRNNQEGSYIEILPEPSWMLVDFNKSVFYERYENTFVIDSIKKFDLKPTKNAKKILGLEAKEFIVETDDFSYSFWLAKQNELNISPAYFQLKGYVILELKLVDKKMEKTGGERISHYLLKEINENKHLINLRKNIPKKFKTIEELRVLKDKQNQENLIID